MNKTYGDPHNPITIVPLDLAVLVANLIRGGELSWELLVQVAVQLAVMIPLHRFADRRVARLVDGKLVLLAGVGLRDQPEIPVRSITRLERLTRRFLNIHFEGKVASVEATPRVLDEIERDLSGSMDGDARNVNGELVS